MLVTLIEINFLLFGIWHYHHRACKMMLSWQCGLLYSTTPTHRVQGWSPSTQKESDRIVMNQNVLYYQGQQTWLSQSSRKMETMMWSYLVINHPALSCS